VENKNPLDVDNSKMTRDICNGVSQSEIRRRYGNGYYDKDRKQGVELWKKNSCTESLYPMI
jgi:hypothetical protein